MKIGTLSCLFLLSACASGPKHPCADAGEPAREKPASFKGGDRQCEQRKSASGKWQNDGRYIEWYPSGAPALVGEYKEGKRSGKWIEYDPAGKKLSERWFEDGVETPTRADKDSSEKKPKP